MPLVARDTFNRPLRDLRISVTDRCNFRCTYCMPKEVFGHEHPFLPRGEILTFEEITRLSRIFLGLGIEKIRITGGEPLLRKDIDHLVAMLASLPGLHDLTLTTNGSLLADQAQALRRAGLHRLTVSLDSLNPETFASMNDVKFPLSRVLNGIEAAAAAGFRPIKLNAVVRRNINEEDIVALAKRFSGPEFHVRYIEYMDVGTTNHWQMEDVVSAAEILQRLTAEIPLERLPSNYRGEVAQRYRQPAGGEIGIIASVTQPFCRDCTRARLSADGHLYTCLFANHGHDLRALLRSDSADEAITRKIQTIWSMRDDRYSERRADIKSQEPKVEMSAIGG